MVLKTSDVKLPEGVEDIDDLNMHFEAQRKYNQKRDAEDLAEGFKRFFIPLIGASILLTLFYGVFF